MAALSFSKIKELYPDEWVLLGDPVCEGTEVVSGHVLLHHKDKKELTIRGRDLIHGFSNYRVVFTGVFHPMPRLGILRRLKTT